MNKDLESCIKSILDKGGVNTLYLYGSYVNGYYKDYSDIDVVVVSNTTDTIRSDKPISFPPNISIHYVQSEAFHFFDTGKFYAHLRMLPIYNEEECNNISKRIKSEIVRRELIRFKRKGIVELGVLDPLKNFLLEEGIKRPWRIKPIKRMFRSEQSEKILSEEYKKIFRLLEQKGMVNCIGEKYKINPDFIFDEGVSKLKVKGGLAFKFVNSYGGLHYLINLPTIINFAIRRI